ncbi:MAG: chemotaxis protein CheA, partial [Scytonema sp. PMC 1069.18]|nr:chemotaxis protein CheA [Scytonema sp. PMC 1069.18]
MDEDIQAFLIDSYEHLDSIERDLVALEQNPADPELLVRIYRSLHTLKGNSGFLAFANLEAITHSGENLLSRLREGELNINSDITSVLLELVDTIQRICAQIEATGKEEEEDYSELIERLNHPSSQRKLKVESIEEQKQENDGNPISSWDNNNDTLSSSSKSIQSIRVNINLLDKLMNLVGELVLVRNQILQFQPSQEETTFVAMSQQLNRVTTELQEGVMKTRMQPISTIWNKFPRVVRDIAVLSEKQVYLEVEGEDTELDKTILEAIKDPLTHLIRNCVDHGIECPEVREAHGKSTEGHLYLKAFHESGYVNIEITDDGTGINPEILKQRAVTLGLMTPERCDRLSNSEAVNLIFLPGFSTAEQVTRLSGRGVGMDVVKSNIEKVGGTVDVHSQLGQGTTFKLKIPLTLAIIPALIVTSGGENYAIPQMSLLELVRLEGEQAHRNIERVYDAPVYRLRDKLLPLVYLNRELQLEETGDMEHKQEMLSIVVLQANTVTFGLVVDAINDTQEIVVKPLGKLLKKIPCFAGSTILGDGKVALILDAIGVAQKAGVLSEEQSNSRLQQEELTSQNNEKNYQMLLLFQTVKNNRMQYYSDRQKLETQKLETRFLKDTGFLEPQLSLTEQCYNRMALPLSRILRLEEIPRHAVEQVGHQMVVQYRDQILPLIDLTSVFYS